MATWALPGRKPFGTVSIHCGATILLTVALVPILRSVGLPLRFTWTDYLISYWLVLPVQSVFAACLLYVAAFPCEETLAPVFQRIGKQKVRLLFLVPVFALLVRLTGLVFGFVLFVDAIAMLEFLERSRERRKSSARVCFDILIPAAYLFIAHILIFAYNDVIALQRYDGSWELVLNRVDAFVLGGHTISPLAHAALSRWPQSIPWLQIVYFAMFPQVGAAIAILALRDGRSMALKFVGTIVTAYYISLFIFFWLPTTGPYAICRDHFSFLPAASGAVYETQKNLINSLSELRLLRVKNFIGMDYFIGFPSMHIVQSLVVLWFLRRWKPMVIALVAFDLLLVPAILLLEQHYLVDLVAALPVAALAIAITTRERRASDATSAT
jgi:hypothetical protein